MKLNDANSVVCGGKKLSLESAFRLGCAVQAVNVTCAVCPAHLKRRSESYPSHLG